MIAERFIARGVTQDPADRRRAAGAARRRPIWRARLGRHLGDGLDELTMTTNGNAPCRACRRRWSPRACAAINVSLDSRDPETLPPHHPPRRRRSRCSAASWPRATRGLAVKINMVALKGLNEDEIAPMLAWCVDQGFDLTLIETMPLGAIDEDRADRFLPLTEVFDRSGSADSR